MRAATRRRLVAALASLGALTALVVLLFPLYAVIVASFETDSQLFGASRYTSSRRSSRCPTTAWCCPSRARTLRAR
jgi:ABC-type glycerol-3-phosphate transport system permease component